MAEEEVKYNVSLNEEEISSQLARIRSDIDLTVGALSTGIGSARLPQASDILSAVGGFNAETPGIPSNSLPFNVSNMFDDIAKQAQLGYSKFTGDMRRIGLLSSPQYPSHALQGSRGIMPEDIRPGFWPNIQASLFPEHAGFNRNLGGMTSAEFSREAFGNIEDSALNFTSNNYGAMLGTSLGLLGSVAPGVGTISGALTGFALGSTVDLAGDIFASRAKERLGMVPGLKQIASQTFGGMSTSRALEMAEIIQDRALSLDGKILGFDTANIQENVIGFSNAGGFGQVTSSNEMKEVLRGVVENTREFANNMKMAQEDAVRVMAELQQSTIVNASEMGTFSARMSGAAERFGMKPLDLIGFGMQGAELVRGTGATAAQGFGMALEARSQTERLRFADPTTRQFIQQMGGSEQFALTQMENASRFMQSGQGMMVTASLLSGGGIPSNLSDLAAGAGDFLSRDPQNYFSLTANQGELSASMGFRTQQSLMVTTATQLARAYGLADQAGRINEDTIVTVMMRDMGMSSQEAKAALMGFNEAITFDHVKQNATDFMDITRSLVDENTVNIGQELSGRASHFIGEVFSSKKADNLFLAATQGIKSEIQSFGDWWNRQSRIDLGNLSGRDLSDVRKFMQSDRYKEITGRELSEVEIQNLATQSPTRLGNTLTSKRAEAAMLGLPGPSVQASDELLQFGNFLPDNSFERFSQLVSGKSVEDLQFLSQTLARDSAITEQDRQGAFQAKADALIFSELDITNPRSKETLNMLAQEVTGKPAATWETLSEGQQAIILQNMSAQYPESFIPEDERSIQPLLRANESQKQRALGARNIEIEATKARSEYSSGLETLRSKVGGNFTSKGKMTSLLDMLVQNPNAELSDYRLTALGVTKGQVDTVRRIAQKDKLFSHLQEQRTVTIGLENVNRASNATEDMLSKADPSGLLLTLGDGDVFNALIQDAVAGGIEGLEIAFPNADAKSLEELRGKQGEFDASKVRALAEMERAETFKRAAGSIASTRLKSLVSEGNVDGIIKNLPDIIKTQVFTGLANIITNEGIRIDYKRNGTDLLDQLSLGNNE